VCDCRIWPPPSKQEPYALTRPYGSVRGAISDGRPYRYTGGFHFYGFHVEQMIPKRSCREYAPGEKFCPSYFVEGPAGIHTDIS